jgi:hypothetical protein
MCDEGKLETQRCSICWQEPAYMRITESGHRIVLCPACYIQFAEIIELTTKEVTNGSALEG